MGPNHGPVSTPKLYILYAYICIKCRPKIMSSFGRGGGGHQKVRLDHRGERGRSRQAKKSNQKGCGLWYQNQSYSGNIITQFIFIFKPYKFNIWNCFTFPRYSKENVFSIWVVSPVTCFLLGPLKKLEIDILMKGLKNWN